jgi:UDP-N-acetylmuramate dehydrogenase
MNWEKDVSLASRTWWKVGGNADFFVEPTHFQDLKAAYLSALEKKLPVTVLGGGSNVLISDEGVRGLVLSTRKFKEISAEEKDGALWIRAQAGTPKADVVKIYLQRKLDPALFLCGLPGDVGGGVFMNAGVSEAVTPREFCEIVHSIEVLKPDGALKTYAHDELIWSYRKTKGWQKGVITTVILKWPLKENPQVMNLVREATKRRLSKQPLNMPSGGSTFKNPLPDKSAGFLIEQAGLKGFQIGGARVSEKHANFIVNIGGAKAADVDQVIRHVRKTVFEKFSIELETEVRYLGQWT